MGHGMLRFVFNTKTVHASNHYFNNSNAVNVEKSESYYTVTSKELSQNWLKLSVRSPLIKCIKKDFKELAYIYIYYDTCFY